jgi:hypothetical protein
MLYQILLPFEPDSAELAVQCHGETLHGRLHQLVEISMNDDVLPVLGHRHLINRLGRMKGWALSPRDMLPDGRAICETS